jgi:hypothetical protein
MELSYTDNAGDVIFVSPDHPLPVTGGTAK